MTAVGRMTSHVGRLYALVASVLLFFVLWAAIAAHPWQSKVATTSDPRLAALAQREQNLRREATLVQRIVAQRSAAYGSALAQRRTQLASTTTLVSSPSVRVVTLPPLTITKTS